MALPANTGLEGSVRETRFAANVIWAWASVIVSAVAGLLLTPYLIRKLGSDGYGVWALCFSLVDYYWFFDLGFRSATVKYVAHHTAREELEKISEVLSTSLLYAAILAVFLGLIVPLNLSRITHFFKVAPAYQSAFTLLLLLVTMSWAVGVVFGLFGASIEAVQRLDLTTKVTVTATTVRVLGTAVLLYLGYGLVPVGLMVISSQVVSYVLYFYFYRRLFTGVRLSLHLASLSKLKELSKFGIHSFLMTFSTQLQSQSAPVLIGHFLPAAFVGYYNLPMRLVQYAVEFVAKIGIVTNINAAELSAKDDTSTLSQLAIYTNRYCLVIFMPLAILLWVDGRQFFTLWVGEKVAVYSVQVLPILLLGFVVAVVGQFSSSMLLMGMAKHQRYARALLAEALLGFVLLTYAIPRYGMVGAAWVVAVLMILIRGVYTWYIVSQTVGISMWSYVRGVYLSPVMAAVPVFILAKILKTAVIPGHSWFQIALLGAVIGLTYYSVALFVSARSDHRRLLLQKLGVG